MRLRKAAGLLVGLGLLAPMAAGAGELCGPETAGEEPRREIVVVVPEPPGGERVEATVAGGPSQSVRVIAPASATVTAVGGDGAAGTPGTPGQ